MAWFESRSTKEKKSLLATLVVIMAADGDIAAEELGVLVAASSRLGVSQSELEKILNNPGDIKLVTPKDESERFRHLSDAIFMMVCDGNIDKREKSICRTFASKLEFRPVIVDKMADVAIRFEKNEITQEELTSELYAIMSFNSYI